MFSAVSNGLLASKFGTTLPVHSISKRVAPLPFETNGITQLEKAISVVRSHNKAVAIVRHPKGNLPI
jgi:hypothetical protein